MKNIYEFIGEYDGTVEVQASEDNYESLWIDVTDCDGERTITVRLPAETVGNLALVLSDWFDVASRRRR